MEVPQLLIAQQDRWVGRKVKSIGAITTRFLG